MIFRLLHASTICLGAVLQMFWGDGIALLDYPRAGRYIVTMRWLQSISLVWLLILIGALALIFGLRAFFAWMAVSRDAKADYAYKQANGMVPDVLDRENYEQIYRRVYSPRGPIHVAGAMIAILLVTPLAMKLFELGFNLLYNLSGQSRVIEPGYLVWHFFLFFSMIAVWVGVAYLAARRYHRTMPGSLQYEMDQYLYGDDDYGETF